MEQLTVKEALEQGYEHYVYNNDGFQSLMEISDIKGIDFSREDIRIVGKDVQHPSGISSKDLSEMIADQLQCQYSDETGDDTESVYDAIKELDFTDMENKISEALSKVNYYSAIDIKLIPDNVNNLQLYKQITFKEFIQHGIDNGANIVNGMPWSWQINGKSVTHENDDCYIIQAIEGNKKFHSGEFIIAYESGLSILVNRNTHSPGGCPL